MTADRDPAIGALLDRLPVELPAPAFWDDLRARLEAADLEPHPVRPAARPRRRRVVVGALAAAAAIVVAVVLGSALRDGRDDLDTGPVRPGPTTTWEQRIPDELERHRADAQSQAIGWTLAVADGDVEGAWAIVGPQSRDSIGGREAFDDLMASALPEGWGFFGDTWRQTSGRLDVQAVPLGSSVAPQDWLVTLSARDPQGELRAAALVVTYLDGAGVVEPFVAGPAIGLVVLPAGPDVPVVAAGSTIELGIEPGASFGVAIDGVQVPDDALRRDDGGAVTGVRSDADDGRLHIVSVAMRTPAGALASHTATYQASGG